MFKKEVNSSVCTCEINVHTNTHLQMCTHLHNNAYANCSISYTYRNDCIFTKFPKYKLLKRI